MDVGGFIVLLVLIGMLAAFGHAHMQNKRRAYLMSKYNDAVIVERIMEKKFWIGMTQEMLVDSLGRPAGIDERLMRTKTSHTYKYHASGVGRYRTRIKLDNGRVVGWDLK